MASAFPEMSFLGLVVSSLVEIHPHFCGARLSAVPVNSVLLIQSQTLLFVAFACYRVYLHPLSVYPGPALWAFT
jgi:hypothetical protein